MARVTGGTIMAVVSEACMVTSGISVALGWYYIRSKRVHQHRRAMLVGAWTGGSFLTLYVLHTLIFGDTQFGGPPSWNIPYLTFLQIHSILATVAGILGIIALRWALRRRFGRHRRVAPWAATLWLIAAGSGLAVFLLLYVIFPPGPTASVWHIMLAG